ncbi:nicotinate (nicotinamide) nucleotide adenylyltransferase [Rickettsiales bacterium]|nr:nicotinate (nicotinamide) nucleotide adenylyltransferase [Rickettsiales bacterium]
MKIGLLGGSFNPPHFGHVNICKDALRQENLDQIWWLPTKQNPFKENSNNFSKRINLCQKIIQNEQKIAIKDYEKDLKDSYFINLLKNIINKYPNYQFFTMVGADNIQNFHKWHKWQEIIDLSTIIIFNRENYKINNDKMLKYCQKIEKEQNIKKIILINNKNYQISSSQIRNDTK